ncbi:MAG TPA: MFS transporter, partial [Solirubrobacteraceae bacterium]|nr:MFS transporter [Solirubrobacteraceae bacterium]
MWVIIWEALSQGLGTVALRRLQVAWSASALGSWIFFVALAVYAYDAGGTTAVGAAALVRMVPAGLTAPLVGVVVDRCSRRDVLVATLLLRAGLVAAIAAAVAAKAPIGAVLALAALFTIAAAAHKPAQAALLPALAQTPRQLGAANALWTGVDNAAFLAGSLAGGALLATTSADVAFAVTALLYGMAALPVAAIPRDSVPAYRVAPAHRGPLAATVAGFRGVAADGDVRLIVGFLTAATLVEGMIDVLVATLLLRAGLVA